MTNWDLVGEEVSLIGMFFFEKMYREPHKLRYARFGEPLPPKSFFNRVFKDISRANRVNELTHNDFLPCRKSVICYLKL